MSYSTLIEGEFSKRLIYIITDPAKRKVTKWDKDNIPFKVICIFTIIQFLLTGVIFGVALSPGNANLFSIVKFIFTLYSATIFFPVFILLLVPIRKFILPYAFDKEHLQSLDPDKLNDKIKSKDDTEIELN